MLLATITIKIKSSDGMTVTQMNNLCDVVDSIDWDTLAEAALTHAGVGETILNQLTFDYEEA